MNLLSFSPTTTQGAGQGQRAYESGKRMIIMLGKWSKNQECVWPLAQPLSSNSPESHFGYFSGGGGVAGAGRSPAPGARYLCRLEGRQEEALIYAFAGMGQGRDGIA